MDNNPINIVVEQIKMPNFCEFCKLNESVDAEMKLYSSIASDVDELKSIYGEKAIAKTGIIKSLMAINTMILTGEKETQSQEEKPQAAQDDTQAQAQTTPPAQAQAQDMSIPQDTPPAQSTQPIQPITPQA